MRVRRDKTFNPESLTFRSRTTGPFTLSDIDGIKLAKGLFTLSYSTHCLQGAMSVVNGDRYGSVHGGDNSIP